MFETRRHVLISLILLVGSAQPTGAKPPSTDEVATGEEIVSIVREKFFDRRRAEVWAQENARYAEAAQDRDGFIEATRAVLRQLKASHTAYYTPDDPQYYALLSIFRGPLKLETVETESIGVDVAPGQFVRVVFASSPAEGAGIRRGDRILSADGTAFHPVLSVRGRAGRPLTLDIQSRGDGPSRAVVVTPRMIDPRQEWLEHQKRGAKIIDVRGKKIAYMPFFSAAGEAHEEALVEEVTGRFESADALVLDFRNGWGGASPTFINRFNRTPPVLEQIQPDGTRGRYDPQWRKPVYFLINGGTTSGKEVLAYAVKRHKIGTLVGERSSGAVVAGQPFLLRDKSLLYLATADVRVDGERLEGHGISPDVEVTDDLHFAAGRDPQLEKALDLAASKSGPPMPGT